MAKEENAKPCMSFFPVVYKVKRNGRWRTGIGVSSSGNGGDLEFIISNSFKVLLEPPFAFELLQTGFMALAHGAHFDLNHLPQRYRREDDE